MTPPTAFVKKLRAYDPALRVVWSRRRECWQLERQVRRGGVHYPGLPDSDVRRRYHDGYIHVGDVAPRHLDERVLLTLWRNDMWAHGGAAAVNAALDDYYETQERRDTRRRRDDLRQVAADMWDTIAWKRKGRIRVPDRITEEVA